MDDEALALILQSTEAAVAFAQDVRATHRKRSPRGSRTREADITIALTRLKRVMRPIRSNLGKLQHYGGSEQQVAQLKAASQALQRERRKLWKMRQRKRTRHGRR